jgi:uncharacterized protein
MFIDVGEIRKSPERSFHFDLSEIIQPISIGSEEFSFTAPVRLSLDVKNTGRVLVMNGHITGDTELTCSRCLEQYRFQLDTYFEEKFCHVSDISDVTGEGQETGDLHVFENNRIEMDDILLENIVLAVPMKTVCSESCRGLCGICGANLNKNECGCRTDDIDPRLSALKKFFQQ